MYGRIFIIQIINEKYYMNVVYYNTMSYYLLEYYYINPFGVG